VHGVRRDFLTIGAAMAELDDDARAAIFNGGAYFLGKALWAKGYRLLIEELKNAKDEEAAVPELTTFGSGRDEDAIRGELTENGLPVRMNGGIDHADPALGSYSIFVNPSKSEVLCTTTAEALAMGKKVLIPRHPSNTFFEQFTNAILYDQQSELIPLLTEALRTPPAPLPPKEQYVLSWEAATERLLDAARIEASESGRDAPLQELAYTMHNAMSQPLLDDWWRENSGATPGLKRVEGRTFVDYMDK